jgi:hypothetical protein
VADRYSKCFYERIGAEEPSKEDVFECFSQAAALLPNLGSVKIVNECSGLMVMADSMLRQLFYNFIDNSPKHVKKSPKFDSIALKMVKR